MTAKTVLIVAAHPDDEVLGCGGTMARRVEDGDQVHVVFMADGATSRSQPSDRGYIEERNTAALKACQILGAQTPEFLGFPDNRMDSIALLDVIQAIENVIDKIQPTVVYTHHGGDLNVDHQITHQGVMTACRPQPGVSVREIYSFEVLSSTEWAAPSAATVFVPNCFVDIEKVLDQKQSALEAYNVEMRRFPHSRSIEAVVALATLRGASMGMVAAEGFKIERVLL